jgi:hypothetical protein
MFHQVFAIRRSELGPGQKCPEIPPEKARFMYIGLWAKHSKNAGKMGLIWDFKLQSKRTEHDRHLSESIIYPNFIPSQSCSCYSNA